MDMMLLSVASRQGSSAPGLLGDSCAVFLFIAGVVSLAIAGYLLYKAPKAQPVRFVRRH